MKRLYVGNLPFHTTEDDLRSIFASIGEVDRVNLINDRETGRSRGFGFVSFVNDADADKAIDEWNGRQYDGRALTVNEAKDRSDSRSGGFKSGGPPPSKRPDNRKGPGKKSGRGGRDRFDHDR